MNALKSRDSVSSRIISVLRLFAESGENLSVHEIATRLDMAPSSVHRLLAGLVDLNIIDRAARRQYCVGREFVRIGALAARKISIPRLARPMLRQISIATGETSVLLLYQPGGRDLTVADKIEAIHALRYRVMLHSKRDLIWGAMGTSVTAWLDPTELTVIRNAARPSPATGDPPPSLVDLSANLRSIQRQGYAISIGQVALGVVDIAAGFFDAQDHVAGSLAITIPEMRYRKRDEARLSKIIVEEAAKLSIALGSQRPSVSAISK